MWSDLRNACRTLMRQPVLAAVIIVTVALGIGGSTAVFSVVNAVLIRDLPYSDADRIYVVRAIGADGLPGNISRREFAPIYEHETHPTVQSAAIVWSQETHVVGIDQRPHPTVRYGVTDGFFEVFGTRMALGRGFERDDVLGRIVISYPIWRDVYGADPDIIGKSVSAEGMMLEVVGVTPADFEFPENPGFWFLMRIGEERDNVRVYRGFLLLRPDRSQSQIQNDLTRLADELGPDPVTGQQPVLVAEPMLEYVVGNLRGTVLVLFGATGLLLLIACINITSLLLSRATVRARELALREAVGARRSRIVRQLLTETLVPVLIGGVFGLALVVISLGTLVSLAPEGLPRLDRVPIDGNVLLFAGALTVVTAALVGLSPAWRLTHNALRSLINESGRGTPAGVGRNRLFSGLVVTEIALALVVVTVAGLLVRSYVHLTSIDPGFNADGILTATMNITPRFVPGEMEFDAAGRPVMPVSPYAPMASQLRALEERVEGISGVESVGVATELPLARNPFLMIMPFVLPGQQGADDDAGIATTPVRSVSPGYFRTMQMRVLSGRGLQESDRLGSEGVAVVNETFARRHFPGQDPLGQRISLRENRYVPGESGFQFAHLTIEDLVVVGMVSDARYGSLAQPAQPAIYLSSGQLIDRRRILVVRTSLDPPDVLVPEIRRELDVMDPQLGAQFDVYDTVVRSSLARDRLAMTLLTLFAGVALLLAAIGVYGLMCYSVALRQGEIALRAAMGASARQVMRLVMGRGLWLAAAGIVIGVAVAIALRHLVASQLYGVSSLDPPVLLLGAVSLFLVAAVACFLPARRASRVDPAELLRVE